MVVNRKGSWYRLEGHQGGEQKETLESNIGTKLWLTERGLEGEPSSDQKATLEPIAGAPWWRTEESRPEPENKPSPSSLQFPLLTEVSDSQFFELWIEIVQT
jgi:hypothetical protein